VCVHHAADIAALESLYQSVSTKTSLVRAECQGLLAQQVAYRCRLLLAARSAHPVFACTPLSSCSGLYWTKRKGCGLSSHTSMKLIVFELGWTGIGLQTRYRAACMSCRSCSSRPHLVMNNTMLHLQLVTSEDFPVIIQRLEECLEFMRQNVSVRLLKSALALLLIPCHVCCNQADFKEAKNYLNIFRELHMRVLNAIRSHFSTSLEVARQLVIREF